MACQTRECVQGKREHTEHMLRLCQASQINGAEANEIVQLNSHDGTSNWHRVILARNLLGTLRNRELAQVAKDIAAETGLEHSPVADGQHVAGIYQRSVMLASGR